MERIFLLLISALFAFIFFKLYSVLQNDFEEVPERVGDGSMFNLNEPDPGPRMKMLLKKGFYFEDPKDIELISSVIAQRLHPEAATIDNIGELNKRKYDVEAEQALHWVVNHLKKGSTFPKHPGYMVPIHYVFAGKDEATSTAFRKYVGLGAYNILVPFIVREKG